MDYYTVVIDEGIVEKKLVGQHFSDTIRGGHICYTKVERGVV